MKKEEKIEQHEKSQTRKKYAARGESSTKMMTFRCDTENVTDLEACSNKGRTINEALREWFRSRNREEHDHHPNEDSMQDIES